MMDELMLECNRMGLMRNKGKVEVMGVTKLRMRLPVIICVECTALKLFEWFWYMGSLVYEDARCDKEKNTRLGMAKSIFGNMRKVLSNMGLNIQLRLRLLRCYVWSGLLCSCEIWNISSIIKKRQESKEM